MHLPNLLMKLKNWRANTKAMYYAVPVTPGKEFSVSTILDSRADFRGISGIIPIEHDPAVVVLAEGCQYRKRDIGRKDISGYVMIRVEETCSLTEAEIFHWVAEVPGVNRAAWRFFWAHPITEREYRVFALSCQTGVSVEVVSKDLDFLASVEKQIKALMKLIQDKRERVHGLLSYVRENCLRIEKEFFQFFFRAFNMLLAPHDYSDALSFARVVKEFNSRAKLILKGEVMGMA